MKMTQDQTMSFHAKFLRTIPQLQHRTIILDSDVFRNGRNCDCVTIITNNIRRHPYYDFVIVGDHRSVYFLVFNYGLISFVSELSRRHSRRQHRNRNRRWLVRLAVNTQQNIYFWQVDLFSFRRVFYSYTVKSQI
jgi:hypothetical protein